MTERNDAWMKLWDQVPAEHQWIFEQTNEHYNAAFGSMLKVVLQTLVKVEENQDGFAHPLGALVAKQDLITEHLQRQDKALDAVGTEVTMLRTDVDTLRRDVNELQREQSGTEKQLDAILTRLGELETNINGRLSQLLKETKAASRAAGQKEGRKAERADPGGAGE